MIYQNINTPKSIIRLLWLGIVLLPLIILFSNFASAASPTSLSEKPLSQTPLSQAPLTQTGALDLSQSKGKVVYIDFWASWCGPCKASFPYMNALKAQYPESDFQIILVNLDHNKKKADRFLKRVNEPVASIYDPKGVIARQFKVSAMPTSILIGRDGKVRYVHEGFHPKKMNKYSSHIKELLNEK